MSSYIDHRVGPGVPDHSSDEIIHSWRRFTDDRLRWLYGDVHSIERRAAATADLAAWSRLGQGRAAA